MHDVRPFNPFFPGSARYGGTNVPVTKGFTPIQQENTSSVRMMRHHPLFTSAAWVAAGSWFHRNKFSFGHSMFKFKRGNSNSIKETRIAAGQTLFF